MTPTRLAVPLVAGALLVAGCGGGSQTSASSQPAPGRGGGAFAGQNLTKLADALGVSKTRLQTALRSAMPQNGPGDGGPPGGANGAPPSGGPPGAGATPPAGGPPSGGGAPGGGRLASQLAKQLDLPRTKVAKALRSVMPQPSQGEIPGSS